MILAYITISVCTYVVCSVILTWLLWLFYLATMNLWNADLQGKQTKFAKQCSKPILWSGWLLGVLVNTFVMSVILLEFPRETAVSTRLARHLHKQIPDYRTKFAQKFADNLLDAYDPRGKHI